MGFVIITHFEAFIDFFILKQIKNFWGQSARPNFSFKPIKDVQYGYSCSIWKKNSAISVNGFSSGNAKEDLREREETGRGVKYIIIKKRPERHRGRTFEREIERERERGPRRQERIFENPKNSIQCHIFFFFVTLKSIGQTVKELPHMKIKSKYYTKTKTLLPLYSFIVPLSLSLSLSSQLKPVLQVNIVSYNNNYHTSVSLQSCYFLSLILLLGCIFASLFAVCVSVFLLKVGQSVAFG